MLCRNGNVYRYVIFYGSVIVGLHELKCAILHSDETVSLAGHIEKKQKKTNSPAFL